MMASAMARDASPLLVLTAGTTPALRHLTALAQDQGHDVVSLARPEGLDRPGSLLLADWTAPPGLHELCQRAHRVGAASLAIVPDGVQALAALKAGATDVVEATASPALLEARLQVVAAAARRDPAPGASVAAQLAHEVNTPLTYIGMNIAFALRAIDGGAEPQEALDALADALDGVHRVRGVIDGLVGRSLEPRHAHMVDVRRVVESALRLTQEEIGRRARLVRHYGEVPEVRASAVRLWQVFVNLIVNAVQSLPVGRPAENLIRIETYVDDRGRVIVAVADSGPGMSPEVQARAFDPYFTTKGATGTGLGLAICMDIVSDLGGTIAVESRPGEGSVFRVALPPASEVTGAAC